MTVVRYGIAGVCVIAAVTLARWLPPEAVADALLLLAAVVITGRVSGLGPALVACGLATLAFEYYVTSSLDQLSRLIVFLLVALPLAVMSATRRKTDLVTQGAEDLETRVRERTAEHQLRDLVNTVEGIVWEADATTFQFSFVSDQAERILGYPLEQWLSEPTFWKDHLHPDDREWVVSFCERAIREKRERDFEYRMIAAGGSVVWLHDRTTVEVVGDQQARLRGVMIDVTDRRRQDQERRARRWFVEHMDRVNRAIQGTNDLEQMMSDVLEVTLSVFDCDRAWLLYPCDPQALRHGVKMYRTKPEFPARFALGADVPVDPETAEVFRTVRAASGPVQFGPDSLQSPLPADVAKRLGFQSEIAMALYPKGDEPYMFGLSQCTHPKVWTTQEARLFEEIGRRLGDALTSLLIFRNLEQSERRLEEAQRISHVGHWERDLSTDVFTWSDETYRIFGLPPQERVMTFAGTQALVHPDDRERRAAAVAAALGGGVRYDVEYRVVRPTGEVRFVRSQGDVFRDDAGQPRRLFGTMQDITERKRAERRLAAQHAVTEILAEAATLEEATPKILQAVGIGLSWDVATLWRTDRAAGVLRCVEVWHSDAIEIPEFEASCRRTTFPPGSGLPGRVWLTREPLCISDIGVNITQPRAPIGVREGLRAGFGFPIQLGGEVLGVMEFFSPEIREPEQVLVDMMSIVNSQIGQFIERKKAEDALHHAHAELAHVARVATLGEMTASIAHEVNQPLAAIVADANASLNWLAAAEPDLDRVREALSAIVTDGHRASDIIQRIRQLAQKTDPQRTRVDINDVIREIMLLVRPEVRSHDVSLRLDLAPDLRPVLGDRVQLQQVLINLVMNGIEAMDGIRDRPHELAIHSRLHKRDEVLVAVEDAGVGIEPNGMQQMFNAFFTTKPGGMGMGLSISQSIIDAHGGRLWATANATRGVTLYFALPVLEEVPPETDAARPA